jgi:hypothetical protein
MAPRPASGYLTHEEVSMGHGPPDLLGLHPDRECSSIPVIGYRYAVGRGAAPAYHRVSPMISGPAARDAIRAAARTTYAAWSGLLAQQHPSVWAWMQAEAAHLAEELGGGTSAAQVLAWWYGLDSVG